MKPFISNYNWEGINYQPEKYDWKKVEKNNLTIALNNLYDNNDKIYPAKYDWKCKEQDIFLIVPNKKKICCIKKTTSNF